MKEGTKGITEINEKFERAKQFAWDLYHGHARYT